MPLMIHVIARGGGDSRDRGPVDEQRRECGHAQEVRAQPWSPDRPHGEQIAEQVQCGGGYDARGRCRVERVIGVREHEVIADRDEHDPAHEKHMQVGVGQTGDYGRFSRTHQGNLSGTHFGCCGVSGAI